METKNAEIEKILFSKEEISKMVEIFYQTSLKEELLLEKLKGADYINKYNGKEPQNEAEGYKKDLINKYLVPQIQNIGKKNIIKISHKYFEEFYIFMDMWKEMLHFELKGATQEYSYFKLK